MSRNHIRIKGVWKRVRLEILRRDNWTCQRCGQWGDEVDHIVDMHDGGAETDASNLQVLCRGCHIEKSRRPRDPKWRALVEELLESG